MRKVGQAINERMKSTQKTPVGDAVFDGEVAGEEKDFWFLKLHTERVICGKEKWPMVNGLMARSDWSMTLCICVTSLGVHCSRVT